MKKKSRISESIQLGIILALSGGLMDAYTYVCRGHVFANAQTGNILLFGVNLSEGSFSTALPYFYPVLAFTLGIVMSEVTKRRYRRLLRLHWMQITILLEAAILLLVAFLPQAMNVPANCLVSFACGVQVQSFRTINGNGIATTMCIGNLRTATQHISDYLYDKDKSLLHKGLLYYGIILIFAIGAIIGYKLVRIWAEKAIIVSSILMLLGFFLLFFEKEDGEA
ncbi:MAG: YoaK family protein [Oscillospiraceae bacterium]|nr:YoaK family protein [Oscillospiraceae bacterium]